MVFKPTKKTTKRLFRRKKHKAGWWGKFASSAAWSLAKRAAKWYLNPEFKFLDSTTATAPTTTGNIVALTDLLQGDDQSQRQGRSIKVTTLIFRGIFNVGTNTAGVSIRLIIGSSPDPTLPTVGQILQTSAVTSQYVKNSAKKYELYWDRIVNVNPSGQNNISVKRVLRLNHHVRYTGTGLGTEGQGRLFYLFISSGANTAQDTNIRVNFLDN